jgi:hypothetical protein
VGFQLIPIVDFNEITFHNLECIHTHLRNTKVCHTITVTYNTIKCIEIEIFIIGIQIMVFFFVVLWCVLGSPSTIECAATSTTTLV